MIWDYAENIFQLLAELVALLLCLFYYISSKRREWIYGLLFFLCGVLSSYFFTAYLIIMGAWPKGFDLMTYAGWNLAFLFLFLLVRYRESPEEKRYFHPMMLFPLVLNLIMLAVFLFVPASVGERQIVTSNVSYFLNNFWLVIICTFTGAISLTAITDASSNTIGFETVTQISGTNLHKGAVFNVAGLNVVDTSGIQTTVPVQIVVVDVNAAGTVGYISPLRITIDGKATHNPNAWVPAGTSSLTLTYALKADTDYVVAEVRTKECFCYDTYQFDVLPGEKDEVVAGVGGSNLKLRMYGDGTNLNKMFRIDSTYAASLFEPREACLILIEK